MRKIPSSAFAIAWEFRQRHRWGFVAIAVYVIALVTARLLIFGDQLVATDDIETVAYTTLVPLSAACFYLLAVFSFGLTGDVAARQSMFPARLFTLPVTSAALAGWPMLYGTVAIAALWLITANLAPWPSGLAVPRIWPALFVAVFLAWTQVLTWMPYGLPGVRLIAAVLSLLTIDVIAILAIEYKPPEAMMIAILAPQLPLAFVAARFAVGLARRGAVPDWRNTLVRLTDTSSALDRSREPFASPKRAQLWFEWRRYGRSLPTWVAAVLPAQLFLLWVLRETPSLVFFTLLAVLLTPPFMAAFAKTTDAAIPTRPLSTTALTAAKLQMTIASTLLAWLLVVIAIPLGLMLSGTASMVIEELSAFVEAVGRPRGIVFALLATSGLLLSTWKQLVQGVCIGLTTREWLSRGSVFLRLSLPIIMVPAAQRVLLNREISLVWNALPWVLAAMVAVKMTAAAMVATRLHRSGLFSERALISGAAGWLALVLGLYGVLTWMVSTPPLVPRYFPALIAILAVPLVRLSAAPLALAANRHGGWQGPSTSQSRRRMVLSAVLILLSVAPTLAVIEAASSYIVNRSNGFMLSSGEKREYTLYVPPTYDATKPTPLVISLHGAAGWGVLQQTTSQWNSVAEDEGFIVVYPSGVAGQGPRVWRMTGEGGHRDVKFIADLIDRLAATYNIDPTRIYANGLSNGGGMSFMLSCALSDRIAAVGMVGAALLVPWERCTGPRAMPLIAFHGTADRMAPYHGGMSWVAPQPFHAIATFTEKWAQRNRCASTAIEAKVAPDVTRRAFSNCANGADVMLYTIDGGGHTWPGQRAMPEWFVGASTRSIDAAREMWRFFRERRKLVE